MSEIQKLQALREEFNKVLKTSSLSGTIITGFVLDRKSDQVLHRKSEILKSFDQLLLEYGFPELYVFEFTIKEENQDYINIVCEIIIKDWRIVVNCKKDKE